MLAYVGVCWPIWRAMAAHLVAMLAYVGLMLAHVEPKDPKNGNSKKNTVKRKIFWWSAAYLGAMWAHLGAMLAYLEGNVGPSWGYVGPSWGYVGPSWGYVGPSWGYVGPSWGLYCSILRPMLAHLEAYVGPCWPPWATGYKKGGKNGRAKIPCKTQDILAWPGGRRLGRRPLSPTERRELPYGYATARGPLAGLRAAAPAADPGKRISKGSLAEVNIRKVPHVLRTMQLFEKVKQYLAKYTWCRWLIGLEQVPQCSNLIKGWWNRQEWRDSWHEACSELNNTCMCIWAERPKTKLLKAIRTRKLQLRGHHISSQRPKVWCIIFLCATQKLFV